MTRTRTPAKRLGPHDRAFATVFLLPTPYSLPHMITVTRLNGKRLVVNAELIRSVEENPDTTIQLINGDHIIVRESMERVVELAVEYGQRLRRILPPS